MLNLERGRVIEVLQDDKRIQILMVENIDMPLREKAINYVDETGICMVDDIVVINTIGNRLELGTGGYNFVYLNLSGKLEEKSQLDRSEGHIIKMKYTSGQIRVKAVEEYLEYKSIFDIGNSIPKRPVIYAILHSMVSPLVKTIKLFKSDAVITCVYTYGGAMNANNSFTLKKLRDEGLINGVVTAGECYGGDYESINIVSGILFGLKGLESDIVIVCCGPGVAGSSTYYGFSTFDFTGAIYSAKQLGLYPVLIPRISMADGRKRHLGISMQSIAILQALDFPVHLPIYKDFEDITGFRHICNQLSINGIIDKHFVEFIEDTSLKDVVKNTSGYTRVMGRDYISDPWFFYSCCSAGIYSVNILNKNKNY